MAEGEVFPAAEVAPCFSPFGVETGGLAVGGSLPGGVSGVRGMTRRWPRDLREVHTGVRGGDAKVGVGSRVERAAAELSPLSSAPRLLDFRRGRGIVDVIVLCSDARFIVGS